MLLWIIFALFTLDITYIHGGLTQCQVAQECSSGNNDPRICRCPKQLPFCTNLPEKFDGKWFCHTSAEDRPSVETASNDKFVSGIEGILFENGSDSTVNEKDPSGVLNSAPSPKDLPVFGPPLKPNQLRGEISPVNVNANHVVGNVNRQQTPPVPNQIPQIGTGNISGVWKTQPFPQPNKFPVFPTTQPISLAMIDSDASATTQTIYMSQQHRAQTPRPKQIPQNQGNNIYNNSPKIPQNQETNIYNNSPKTTQNQGTNIYNNSPKTTQNQGTNIYNNSPKTTKNQGTNIYNNSPKTPQNQGNNIYNNSPKIPQNQGTNIYKNSPKTPQNQGTNIYNNSPQIPQNQGTNNYNNSPKNPQNQGTNIYNNPQKVPQNQGTNNYNNSPKNPQNQGTNIYNNPQNIPQNQGTNNYNKNQQPPKQQPQVWRKPVLPNPFPAPQENIKKNYGALPFPMNPPRSSTSSKQGPPYAKRPPSPSVQSYIAQTRPNLFKTSPSPSKIPEQQSDEYDWSKQSAIPLKNHVNLPTNPPEPLMYVHRTASVVKFSTDDRSKRIMIVPRATTPKPTPESPFDLEFLPIHKPFRRKPNYEQEHEGMSCGAICGTMNTCINNCAEGNPPVITPKHGSTCTHSCQGASNQCSQFCAPPESGKPPEKHIELVDHSPSTGNTYIVAAPPSPAPRGSYNKLKQQDYEPTSSYPSHVPEPFYETESDLSYAPVLPTPPAIYNPSPPVLPQHPPLGCASKSTQPGCAPRLVVPEQSYGAPAKSYGTPASGCQSRNTCSQGNIGCKSACHHRLPSCRQPRYRKPKPKKCHGGCGKSCSPCPRPPPIQSYGATPCRKPCNRAPSPGCKLCSHAPSTCNVCSKKKRRHRCKTCG